MIRPRKVTTACAGVLLLFASSCVPRPRMCTASSDCVAQSSCVAGRCQPDKPNVKPAVDSARRLVVHPVDIAYLRRGDRPTEELPSLFTLGKDGGVLLLRFSVTLPKDANIVEAYLLLRRSSVVDDDPAPIFLHATRIVEAWNGRSTSWARAPQMQESRSPTSVVEPGGASLIRLDVRELVRYWTRHDPHDQGLAVVAENETRTGTTFALRESGGTDRSLEATLGFSTGRASDPRSTSAPDVEPTLELYVR